MYENLKSAVTAVVKQNGANEITGQNLQSVLLAMIDVLGKYGSFVGLAQTNTTPTTDEGNLFYIAAGKGTYSGFGLSVGDNELAIFSKPASTWTKLSIPVKTKINDGEITTAMLANGCVTTAKIADGNVTTAKIADGNVTTAKIADGNVTTAKIADGAVTEGKIARNAVTSTKIADSSVTTSKIMGNAITTDKLDDLAVTRQKIANGAVETNTLADNAVTTPKIKDGNVTTAKIADGNVTTAKIADGNVTTAKIGNSAVTTDKLDDGAVTSDKIYSQAVTTDEIANSAVTTAKIADEAVTSQKIAALAVQYGNLADNACDGTKIANNSIRTANLQYGSVTTPNIADRNVTTEKLADGAVTTAKFANGSVTQDKLASDVVIPLAGVKIFNLTAYANDDYIYTNVADETTLLNGITYSDLVNGENKLFGLWIDTPILIAGILRQFGGNYYITGNYRERFYSIYIIVIGSSITNIFVEVSNMARRTRRTGISQSELTRLSSAVAEQNLEKYGFKVGDSFTVGTRDYVIAGLNPMKGTSTPYRLTENHVGLIVIPHTTQKWNESGNTYTGGDGRGAGYANSDLHHYLVNTLLPLVQGDLGSSHLLAHNKLLSNAVNQTGTNKMGSATGCSSGWGWVSSYISALSEVQVYGATVWSSSGFDTGEACRQLDVFRVYNHTEIFGGEYPWLRDVVSASLAAIADDGGRAGYSTASNARYVAALVLFK